MKEMSIYTSEDSIIFLDGDFTTALMALCITVMKEMRIALHVWKQCATGQIKSMLFIFLIQIMKTMIFSTDAKIF